jgi:ABC-type bacteriocin/lantibiotic exporter with double-glycine peptidase domain
VFATGLKSGILITTHLKLSKEEILEIEPPFIAHIDIERGQLALVEKTKNGKVTFSVNKEKKLYKAGRSSQRSSPGGVIVMEPNQQGQERQITGKSGKMN